MTLYYPLNGVDLDFSRYEHRTLGGRDVMVNRIMEDYMFPRRVKPGVYLIPVGEDTLFGTIKAQSRELGLDIQVMPRLLETGWTMTRQKAVMFVGAGITLYQAINARYMNWFGSDEYIYRWPAIETMILGLVQRHFLEADPLMRIWLKNFRRNSPNMKPNAAPGWRRDMIEHMKMLQKTSRVQHENFLFSGGHWLPINGPSNLQFSVDPCFVADYVTLNRLSKAARECRSQGKGSAHIPLMSMKGVHRGRPRRSRSTPPPGSWNTATIQGSVYPESEEQYYVIFYPRRPLSELDKISRRRSLSRTHIRAMFIDKPKWHLEDPTPSAPFKHPCANCAQHSHHTRRCPSTCGYCNSPFHKASACTIKAINRCKCRPFPQYHTASECFVRCSRKCGSPYPPGHFRHKNAIMCSHRCCMCGIRGHTGRKCSLKKCPCGQQHLSQDCRWKVECSVKQCDRYNCHLHCRECGRKKGKGAREQFVGNTCQDCLKNGKPVSARAA
ncbi:hypothetical protein F4779DRAFT_558871 [Xylariaceae sp. FL0662B]|nr:hypothetical protein F4779DRAFT_558871 [Xylariaceae sp. FL0662B]